MSNKKVNNSIFAVTLNITIASILSALVISWVYSFTEGRIIDNRKMLKEEAMRRLVPQAVSFAPSSPSSGILEARSANGLEGFILPVEGRGYGGTIKMIAAADTEGRIIGFEILSHNETPGLGDLATGSEFRDQFTGHGHGDLEITKTHEVGKIDAISGATITSRAVAHSLDEALSALPVGTGGNK